MYVTVILFFGHILSKFFPCKIPNMLLISLLIIIWFQIIELPAVRRTQPSTKKRPKFLQQPMSNCYNGYMVNNNNWQNFIKGGLSDMPFLEHKTHLWWQTGICTGNTYNVRAPTHRHWCTPDVNHIQGNQMKSSN